VLRLESSGVFFSLLYIYLNYANEYSKILYLRMETSGAAGDYGAGDKRGHKTHRPQVCFLLLYIYINYINEYLKVLCLRMETSGAAGKGYGGWG
jgi:hypothetical protein